MSGRVPPFPRLRRTTGSSETKIASSSSLACMTVQQQPAPFGGKWVRLCTLSPLHPDLCDSFCLLPLALRGYRGYDLYKSEVSRLQLISVSAVFAADSLQRPLVHQKGLTSFDRSRRRSVPRCFDSCDAADVFARRLRIRLLHSTTRYGMHKRYSSPPEPHRPRKTESTYCLIATRPRVFGCWCRRSDRAVANAAGHSPGCAVRSPHAP